MRVFWLAAIFFLQSQLPDQIQPGTVTGRLRSIDGSPASGVRIAAVAVPEAADKSGTSAMFGISATNSDGSYRLEKLPPGRYYIFAGLIDLPSYYPNATALDRATAIVVDAGTTVSGIDFTLARPQGLTVSGRLEIPSTMQFSDSWIVTLFSQTRGPTASPMQSKVQRDGTFHFDRVSPGDYRISANLAGAASAYVKAVDADLLNLILPVVDCNAGVQELWVLRQRQSNRFLCLGQDRDALRELRCNRTALLFLPQYLKVSIRYSCCPLLSVGRPVA
jgi:hypothetical protein